MNNKGFSLIELIVTITLFSIIFIVAFVSIGDTFGLSSEKSYEIVKKSIITQAQTYIYECDNEIVNCDGDYAWDKQGSISTTSFYLDVMKKYAYLSERDYINPITNKEISNCLIVNVTKDSYSKINIFLDDSKCEK